MNHKSKYIIVASLLFLASGFNTLLAAPVGLDPNLDCDIQLNQVNYNDGEMVTVDVLRIANLGSAEIAIEIKIWLGVPDTPPFSISNAGSDGTVLLPGGTDIVQGPMPILPVTTALPPGSYQFSCRMLDPITGELLAEDLNSFYIPGNVFAVGSTGPAGGIVIYITGGGLHGLEAAPVDQGTAEWGCRGINIAGADRTDMDAGSANTADILAGCATPDIAARLADNYSLNGFNDWFLPSIGQLNEVYLQKDVVGGFVSDLYWSSSDITDSVAWYQRFSSGGQDGTYKNSNLGVRAVRTF